MVKTVNEIRYDTETADELGTRQDERNPFSYSTLYKSPKGTFFATVIDKKNEIYGLSPMTRKEAFDFAQKYGFEGVITDEFQDLLKLA